MDREPILAQTTIRPNWSKVSLTFTVYGGLHYLKGNGSAYFSLTSWSHRLGFPNQCQSGGADHAEILKRFPRFADLAALHLSGADGVPMHAEANGWYWLAGALGGMGEDYHGGSGAGGLSPADCLAIFASHCRISTEEAQGLADKCAAAKLPNAYGALVKCAKAARDTWREAMEGMRSRWKAEAEACISHHGLATYGDPLPVAADARQIVGDSDNG